MCKFMEEKLLNLENKIYIENKIIDIGQPCYVIAEIEVVVH